MCTLSSPVTAAAAAMQKEKRAKTRGLSYEQRQRLEELEGNLFGKVSTGLGEFGKEEQQFGGSLPYALLKDAAQEADGEAPLLIWEDKRPAEVDVSEGEEASASDIDHDSAERPAGSTDSETESPDSALQTSPPSPEHQPVMQAESGRGDSSEENDEDEGPVADALVEDAAEDGGMELADRRASGRLAGPSGKRKPVWEDPEDDTVEVNIAAISRLRKLRQAETDTFVTGREYSKRLQQQHAKLHPRTSWASLEKARTKRRKGGDSDEDDEEDESLQKLERGAGSLLTGRHVLPAGLLETTRVKDANQQEPNNAVVQSVEFHPNGQLLLTAGLDKRLRFFQVDGVKNAKVQSIYLEDLPIHKAAFANGGSQVIASGRRKHFYLFDLAAARVERVAQLTDRAEKSLENFAVSPATERPLVAFLGAQGYLPLVSLASRQVVAQLKMPGSVRSATFSDDGLNLLASGGDGVVHTWDMRMQRCISRFVDEGTRRGISLASSPGDRLLAAGSDAGFVNIYNQRAAVEAGRADLEEPTAAAIVSPVKTLTNLTTAVDNLAFSPDGQILAMASRWKKDALRMVHTGTMTVFSNWPTSRSPINFVHSMAFSPNGGFFAIGNAKGRVLLYRMHHYSQA